MRNRKFDKRFLVVISFARTRKLIKNFGTIARPGGSLKRSLRSLAECFCIRHFIKQYTNQHLQSYKHQSPEHLSALLGRHLLGRGAFVLGSSEKYGCRLIGYRYMLMKAGGTAGHHGRYGERNFVLLLALQKGTCRARSKAQQQGKDARSGAWRQGTRVIMQHRLFPDNVQEIRRSLTRKTPSLSPPPYVRFRGEADTIRQANRLNWSKMTPNGSRE